MCCSKNFKKLKNSVILLSGDLNFDETEAKIAISYNCSSKK